MSILQQVDAGASLFVSTHNQPIENLLGKEWLLTNGRGGYASSTIAGCNTRAYHGLLIGAMTPPVNRIMGLSNCLETIISDDKILDISTFEFDEKFSPAGHGYLKTFRQDVGVHYDFEFQDVGLTKSVYLLRDTQTVAIEYDFVRVRKPVEFTCRPFVGLRDFHALQKSHVVLCSRWVGSKRGGLVVGHEKPDSYEMLLRCPDAVFVEDPQWWFDFVYRSDRARGQDCTEDLWAPGFFKCRIDSPARIVLQARLADSYEQTGATAEAEECTVEWLDMIRRALHRHRESTRRKAQFVGHDFRFPLAARRLENSNLDVSSPRFYEALCLAAEAFVAERQTGQSRTTTILAGYPWFADWGRDAFIALPGLLLATGRFDDAKSVLATFAAAADKGMIPNRFDDRSPTAHFNSVDASLWFVNAAFQYLRAAGDSVTFTEQLLPTIRWILNSYYKGTRFGIRADDDGLITAGDERTQLTWMDAKYDGVTFTPRFGKAVEVNALWYNCLMQLRNTQPAFENCEFDESLAEKARTSFRELFWNSDRSYLNDCILPDGSVDDRLRPNQVFAVSLEFSPLTAEQQKSVVDAVQSRLLTPFGLRTLDPAAEGYRGRYAGSPRDRDAAYHQGTVWPYLIGAFIEAYLKVNGFSGQSKAKAAGFILPLIRHLTESGCIGSVAEIFDGDEPQEPRGCIAQAWSVAELIRAYQLVSSR